jgi:hypothetical protein
MSSQGGKLHRAPLRNRSEALYAGACLVLVSMLGWLVFVIYLCVGRC